MSGVCVISRKKAGLISKPWFWSSRPAKNPTPLIWFLFRTVGATEAGGGFTKCARWLVRVSAALADAQRLSAWPGDGLQGWITLNRSDAISTAQRNTKHNMQASGSITPSAALVIIFHRPDSVCQPHGNNGALAERELRGRHRFKASSSFSWDTSGGSGGPGERAGESFSEVDWWFFTHWIFVNTQEMCACYSPRTPWCRGAG